MLEWNRSRSGLSVRGGKLVALLKRQSKASLYCEQIDRLCDAEGAQIMERSHTGLVHPSLVVQTAPSPSQLGDLSRLISRLVEIHRLDGAIWLWRREETLGVYLRRLHHACEGRSDGAGPKGEAEWAVLWGIERQARITNEKAPLGSGQSSNYCPRASSHTSFCRPMGALVGCFAHADLLDCTQDRQRLSAEDDRLRGRVVQAALRAQQVQGRLDRAVFKSVLDRFFVRELHRPMQRRRLLSGAVTGIDRTRKGGRIYVQCFNPVRLPTNLSPHAGPARPPEGPRSHAARAECAHATTPRSARASQHTPHRHRPASPFDSLWRSRCHWTTSKSSTACGTARTRR